MKRIVILALLILATKAFSKVIYTEPEFATENDSIIVYFDATEAERTDLVDYTGDLYVHTGVNTNLGEWQYVIGDWGDNGNQAKLERLDDNSYKLVIGYPREFYNISNESEKILSLNFVFRSADGNSQTEDIFYDLFEPGITAVIDTPSVNNKFGHPMRDPLFFKLGDKIGFKVQVVAIGTEADSLKMYKNDSLLYALGQVQTMEYWEVATKRGAYCFEIIVSDTAGLSDTLLYGAMVNEEVTEEPLPIGVEPGINLMDDGSAVMALFAPYKEFVYLVGDFNDWKVDEDFLMKKYSPSVDSVIYWCKVNNITADQYYKFQYFIDGELRIADPYTQLVLDPWNDEYIDDVTFPNRPLYPTGKTDQIVSTFRKKSNDFQWSDEDYVKPDKAKLVIYELLIRDFTDEHTFASTLEKLDYLDSLGINAVELMPVNEFEGNLSWGYNPSFYFAVDKYYGTPDNLKRFVNECHKRGIAVIGDLVLNHSYDQSPLARMYWNSEDYKPAANNPWYNADHNFANPDAQWGNDFNHESPHTQYFVDRVNRYWIEEFHFDGYRFDFTKGFSNTSYGPDSWGSDYDISRINNLKRMTNVMESVDSNAYAIFEHLAVNDEEKALADHGILLWGNMNSEYNQASMGHPSGPHGNWDFSWGYYRERDWNEPHLVTYMESHDEERLMVKNLKWGNSSDSYDIKHLYTALQRQKLVNAFFLTLPGPKMIWQFGELGYDYSINHNGRLGEKPIRWDYYSDDNRRNLYKTIQALLRLRDTYDIFTSSETSVTLDTDDEIKELHFSGSMNVEIVGNFDVVEQEVTVNFPYRGMWYDFFGSDTLKNVNTITKTFAPGEFHIYSDQKLFTPEQELLVDTEEREKIPEKFDLFPAYPNPFNPSTKIGFTLPEPGDVWMTVYNVQGKKVYSKKYSSMNVGYNNILWNAEGGHNISTGIYFIQIRYKNYKKINKVLFVK